MSVKIACLSVCEADERAVPFWKRVQRKGAGERWPWTGPLNAGGYGRMFIPGRPPRQVASSRVAWVLANRRAIAAGMHVLHSCDTPACCNPQHLRLGTHDENMRDKVNRQRTARGAEFPHARLTDERVREMRSLRAAGETIEQLAEKFGVGNATVSRVCSRDRWRHVA